MKTKNKCVFCKCETNEQINGVLICKACEKTLLNELLKRNTPKGVKSIFLKDNSGRFN